MNADILIEKNVPMPKGRLGSDLSAIVVAIEKMEVGDSFAYTDSDPISLGQRIRDAAKRVGMKITIRKVDVHRYRAWRVE